MALPVLDGNQSATTLSSVVTGGEHIVAHTVVSLGSTAISNITNAVSGSVVSISNFPSTQTIAGTVTAGLTYANLVNNSGLLVEEGTGIGNKSPAAVPIGFNDIQIDNGFRIVSNTEWPLPVALQLNTTYQDGVNASNPLPISGTVTVGASSVTFNSNVAKRPDGSWQPLSVEAGSGYVSARVYQSDIAPFLATVTVGNSVTIGSLPAISGTVTANLLAQKQIATAAPTSAVLAGIKFDDDGTIQPISSAYPVPAYLPLESSGIGASQPNNAIQVGFETEGNYVAAGSSFPFPVTGTVTIGSLPAISGTVTANNPNGALTTRFGSVTTANTAQITSAVTNTSRKYLLAQNISAGTVTIGIGFSPTTTQGIQLAAGGGLTFDAFCPTGAVYWLGAVTGAAFTILEG